MLDLSKTCDLGNKSLDMMDKYLGSKLPETMDRLSDKSKNIINNDDCELNAKIGRLLSAIKELNENNKNNKTLKYIVGGAAIYFFPCITAIGYVSVKGIGKINEIVKIKGNEAKRERNYNIFLDLFVKLGFDEKLNDIRYEPNLKEIEELCSIYNKSTGGDNLMRLLGEIFN